MEKADEGLHRQHFIERRRAEGEERIREVTCAEAAGVIEADLVAIVLPGGRGTHVELGIVIGRIESEGSDRTKPRVLLFGRDAESFARVPKHPNTTQEQDRRDLGAMHDANGSVCAFYLHPAVRYVDKSRGIDGLRLEALRAWRDINEGEQCLGEKAMSSKKVETKEELAAVLAEVLRYAENLLPDDQDLHFSVMVESTAVEDVEATHPYSSDDLAIEMFTRAVTK